MPQIVRKILYALLGLICTGLGIIGIWLPGLPTTVFVLIALWAFSKSSKRLYRWFTRIPLLKLAIRESHRFQREGTLAPRVKFISQGSAWLSFAIVTALTQNMVLALILALVALSCSVFMYIVPSSQPTGATTHSDE
ncbi:MAG: hypothetical protein UY35_C0005G0105 [Candidatus Saccharibacteria bacterium GW2011_GWC2_48_9]|nr:MAG: hypothetical protein UY35_C0005G0105 [Candidatus Saccharibacteria bacterium GW2011_GWC2_48_9]HCH34830.1 DUF454 domain-containing protein [Candidatus Saccharibacteria bacterium]